MSKISIEIRKGKITVINRLSYPETVNERVYNAIASGMFDGFLPVSIIQKKKETIIESTVQGLIPINQYFSGIVTKKMFLDFVHELALQVKNCDKNMINANNLDLQSDKIFIDLQTKKVKCIFWPIVNNQRDNPPYLYFRQLPYGLKFDPYEDQEYLNVYKAFFSGLNPFSINSFDKMILKLSGKKTLNGHTTPSEALSGSLSGELKNDIKDYSANKSINIEYDPFADSSIWSNDTKNESKNEVVINQNKIEEKGVVCPSCGAMCHNDSNFCIQCGTKLEKNQKIEESQEIEESFGTTVLGDATPETTVLGYDELVQPVFPKLTRLKTNEVFLVNKPVFRIGSEKQYCDWFIGDNTYISRSHADIITKDGRYYIIDRNSTNKTYVDRKVVPVEKELEIFSGTQIRLANEDFSFEIES